MLSFANLSDNEREAYFRKASEVLGLNASIVEKDFWVCWMLNILFQFEDGGKPFTFKGGTSLSKAYKIIRRFSEDIDISIDKGFLGFSGERDPENVDGTTKRERLIGELASACKEYVQSNLLDGIKTSVKKNITAGHSWSLKVDPEDPDKQTILFVYPATSKDVSIPYIRTQVKMEFGARGDPWPTIKKPILPYVEEAIPGTIKSSLSNIVILQAERTYWEKATILHMLHHLPGKKSMPPRMSRHYYDFYMLTRSKVHKDALSKLSLLERVAIHKAIYFRSAWARYDIASPGTIKLTPAKNRMEELAEDYLKMREMFFEEPPKFEDILKRLQDVEEEIHAE